MSDIINKLELFKNRVEEISNLEIIRVLKKASISEPEEEIRYSYARFIYKVEIKEGLFIRILFDLSNIHDLYHTKLEFIDENYGFDKYDINIHECTNRDIVKCALKLHKTILNILNKKGK